MPLFRESTEENLANKIYYPDDRKYMVRVLATMILAHVRRASVDDCYHVAKALVHKLPFLKEYVSLLLTATYMHGSMLLTYCRNPGLDSST